MTQVELDNGMDLRRHLSARGAVCLQAKAEDWREAVKIGTDLLVAAGTIEARYYDAIVASVDELGPYFLLAPGLAMPHARPEQGVVQNSFALVTLAEPVCFGDPDNDPVAFLQKIQKQEFHSRTPRAGNGEGDLVAGLEYRPQH